MVSCILVIIILQDRNAAEDVEYVIDIILVEYKLAQPKLLVFLKDLFMYW